MEKELALLTEDEMKFLLNLCGLQRVQWHPSNPRYKNKNKSRDALLPIAEAGSVGAAGWTRFVHTKNQSRFDRGGWMDPLCSYKEPKRPQTTSRVGLRQVGEAILKTAVGLLEYRGF